MAAKQSRSSPRAAGAGAGLPGREASDRFALEVDHEPRRRDAMVRPLAGRRERGLIAVDDPVEAAEMLCGVTAMHPQRDDAGPAGAAEQPRNPRPSQTLHPHLPEGLRRALTTPGAGDGGLRSANAGPHERRRPGRECRSPSRRSDSCAA